MAMHIDDLRVRRGFTLLELIVVIAIGGLLLSLVASAIQSSRESARRMQCASHLRQIGIGVHEYQAVHGQLPCSGLLGLKYLASHLGGRAGNWVPSTPPDPCLLDPCPEFGEWLRPGVYLCPTDPLIHRTRRAASFVFSSGLNGLPGGQLGVSDGTGRADVDAGVQQSFSQITDGLSNTACASEHLISLMNAAASENDIRIAFSGASSESEYLRHIWMVSGPFLLPAELPRLFQECDLTPSGVMPHVSGNPFTMRNFTYDHIRPPNSRACDATLTGPLSLQRATLPATSLHRGGVNLLLMDGSARFVSNSVDSVVWRAIGTRDGSEAQSQF